MASPSQASAALASLLLLSSSGARAQATRVGEAPITGPSGPSVNVNAVPNTGGLGSRTPGASGASIDATNLGVKLGVSPGAARTTDMAPEGAARGAALPGEEPAAVRAQASAPQRDAARPQAAQALSRGAGSAVSAGSIERAPERAAAASGRRTLDTAVTEIKKAEKIDAGGEGLGVSSALKRYFDAAGSGRSLAGAPSAPAIVAGRLRTPLQVVLDTAQKGDVAAPQEAAAHYSAAIDAAQAEKALSAAERAGAVEIVKSAARERAQTALTQIANAAYQAAAAGSTGEREVRRAFSGFAAWEKLLGRPGRPLIDNAAHLERDVKRVQELASKPGAAVQAPVIRLQERAGGAFVAALPRASIAKVSESLAAGMQITADPTSALSATWLDQALVDHARAPGSSSLFSSARAGAAAVDVPAAVSAGGLTLRAWLGSLWHFVKTLLARVFGAGDALASVRRAATADESQAAASISGAQALDLSRFNAPYLASQRLRGESSDTRGAALAAVGAARKLAAAHDVLVGDSSGRAMTEKLAERLLSAGTPSAVDLRLLHAWVDRMYAASMGAVLKPLAASAGPVVFFDLTPGSGMVGAIGSSVDAARLSRGGFEIRGGNVAVFGPGGSREDLASALALASGHAEAPVKSRADDLQGALSFVRTKPADAESVALQIQADMARSSMPAFEPVGRLAAEGGALVVSRGARRKGKAIERLYLLTQPATGRVFGYKAAVH